MASVRTYYVVCEDKCLFESMTKEQIITAIAEATGSTPTSIDEAFITKIKEINGNRALQFWVGTQAQYNAIETPEDDVLYLITDPQFETDIEVKIADLDERTTELETMIETGTASGWRYIKFANGIYECWRTAEVSADDQKLNAVNEFEISLPITFVDTGYNVQMTPVRNPMLMDWYGVTKGSGISGKAQSEIFCSYKYNATQTKYATAFDIHIIGRWKE